MAKNTMEEFIEKERIRLNEARTEAQSRKAAIDDEIAEFDRQLAAIAAYDAALSGKGATKRAAGTRGPRTQGRTASLLALIQNSPDGLKRADILEKMGVKGDKSAENSLSTALTGLKKQGKIGLKEGVYSAA